MSKVYLVFDDADYYGPDFMDVAFSSRVAAVEWLQEEHPEPRSKTGYSFEHYIQEVEVQDLRKEGDDGKAD